MPQTLLPSVLGNVVANRQRLSAIRQRIGLESTEQMQGAGRMQAAAPQPPGRPAMGQTNPGQVAMTGGGMNKAVDPSLANPASGNMETGPKFQFDPATRAALLPKIQAFLDQHGPQQQAMADQERQQAQAQQTQPQQLTDPATVQALAPLATFMRQNGRMPTPEELQQLRGQGPLPGSGTHTTPPEPPPEPGFSGGGHFMATEPIYMIGASGKHYGVVGEAGMKERVSIAPTNQPQGRVPQGMAHFDDGGYMDVNADAPDPTQDQPDPTQDTNQPDNSQPDQPDQTDNSQPDQPDQTGQPDLSSAPPPSQGNFPQRGMSMAQARQAVTQHAIQWAQQNGGGDPSGEIQAELDGLDGWVRGANVAPEWMGLLDEVPGLAGLRSTDTGFKTGGGTGQSFGATSNAAPQRGGTAKNPTFKPGASQTKPVHFGDEAAPTGTTQFNAQATPKKPVIGSVQDFVKAKGALPSLDEAYTLGVTQALGGPAKATPEAIFKWRQDNLTGTDKDYFAKFGKLPTLKESVEYEAQSVLTRSLGRAPTAAEKYGYLSAHATDESAADALQGNSLPSPDTLRRLEMANIVGSTTAPKTKSGDVNAEVAQAALNYWRTGNHPGEVEFAQKGLSDFQAGNPVDPAWLARYGKIVKATPDNVKVTKAAPPPEDTGPDQGTLDRAAGTAGSAFRRLLGG